jgi:hypothetical protein
VSANPENPPSLRDALEPSALRAALTPRRPVFANPWDSTGDMFACYIAVGLLDPLLLWAGGRLMGDIFGFDSHWKLGVFMLAALVGAAGFMTIVGRQRTRLAVDVVTITAWFVLGLIVAPILGLALGTIPAIILYVILLAVTFAYVIGVGQWQRGFLTTLSWPVTWSLVAIFFAWTAYELILYQH